MNKNNVIPVVLAADKNYSTQMYITILSAIKNKHPKTFYEFFCLIPEKFSKSVQKEFFKLKNEHINLKFVIMGNLFQSIKMQISHITAPTFYRLVIADILQGYNKAIYLDVDTIVLEDLTELFNTDLGENYIGGVHAASFVIDFERNKEYYNNIGMKDMSYYVNAGVLLWNLDLIRKDNMTEKMLELCKNTYRCMDQDLINLIFYGKIKHLDLKYNMMPSYKRRFLDKADTEQFYKIYNKKEYTNAMENPAIVHYASDIKPWSHSDAGLEHYWHKYAIKSPLKIKKLESPEEKFIKQIETTKFKRMVFWGASIFLENLLRSGKLKPHKIVGIIDKDSSKQGQTLCGYKIYTPDKIELLKPEVIIFAIKHNSMVIYPQIKEYLTNNNIKTKLLPNVFDNNRK